MRYPQTFIDDLKRQADIVRVIQDYVQLKKKGANWMACCPFHKEKTPSFSVSPAKEIFYCFGCHKGGSVFNFVMEIERVAFPKRSRSSPTKSACRCRNWSTTAASKRAGRNRTSHSTQLLGARVVAETTRVEQRRRDRARLPVEARTHEETQKHFRLGYAPDSWDALSTYLRHKGATQQQIDRSGLVAKKEDSGRSYDRFRGRLMFPVFDDQGRPIAFGGRTLKDEDAKYINSPETAAYVKGTQSVWSTSDARRDSPAGFAILVEGFSI
jgi:DNA primase